MVCILRDELQEVMGSCRERPTVGLHLPAPSRIYSEEETECMAIV